MSPASRTCLITSRGNGFLALPLQRNSSTVWSANGLFPRPIRLSGRSSPPCARAGAWRLQRGIGKIDRHSPAHLCWPYCQSARTQHYRTEGGR
jgi:hypothetical protein